MTTDVLAFFDKCKEEVQWVRRPMTLKKAGAPIEVNVEVPLPWLLKSDTAAKIFATKYLRESIPGSVEMVDVFDGRWQAAKKIDKRDPGVVEYEDSIHNAIVRLVGTWVYHGLEAGHMNMEMINIYADSPDWADTIEKRYALHMYRGLVQQRFSFNSPQWFNTGRRWLYGLSDSQNLGLYYVPDEFSKTSESSSGVTRAADPIERPTPHACFIQSAEDSLEGVHSLLANEMTVFKFGSGTGTNLSSFRGRGEPIKGGGVSSGVPSWMKIHDAGAGATKSGGKDRRAAKMSILNIAHPDAILFILLKAREEDKVAALDVGTRFLRRYIHALARGEDGEVKHLESIVDITGSYAARIKSLLAQGYTPDRIQNELATTGWQGMGYNTVTGQNANNSIRVTDDFMEKLDKEGEEGVWNFLNVTDGAIHSSRQASEVMDLIAEANHASADPGIQFHDTINKFNTCPLDGTIRASNPCSEYMFLDDTACNLASQNLMAYHDFGTGKFDFDLFRRDAVLIAITLDISISMAQLPTPKIALGTAKYRTLGGGFANLGGLLMAQGIPYDSDRGRTIAAEITREMQRAYVVASGTMGMELFVPPALQRNKDHTFRVYAEQTDLTEEHLRNTFPDGFRNAQLTVIAPTGTIGLAMGCATLGIEPEFALVKYKELAGSPGEYVSFVNPLVGQALDSLGYTEQEASDIKDHIVEHNGVFGAPHLEPEHYPVFSCAMDPTQNGQELSPEAHLKMMAAAQPFLSGAISKTVNLPEHYTASDIRQLYIKSWELGLKAVAMFRDNCKPGPLSMSKLPEGVAADDSGSGGIAIGSYDVLYPGDLRWGDRRRMPSSCMMQKDTITIGQHKLIIQTAEHPDGGLGEIWLLLNNNQGTLGSQVQNFGKSVSLALQHGCTLEELASSFEGQRDSIAGTAITPLGFIECSGIYDLVFRFLRRRYIPEEATTKKEAPVVQKASFQSLLAKEPGKGLQRSSPYEVCASCGEETLRQNGSCKVCENCGTTTGCS